MTKQWAPGPLHPKEKSQFPSRSAICSGCSFSHDVSNILFTIGTISSAVRKYCMLKAPLSLRSSSSWDLKHCGWYAVCTAAQLNLLVIYSAVFLFQLWILFVYLVWIKVRKGCGQLLRSLINIFHFILKITQKQNALKGKDLYFIFISP